MEPTVVVDTTEANRKLADLEAKLGWLESIAEAQAVADNWE